MDGSAEFEGLKPVGIAVQAAVSEVARKRHNRINSLFGDVDSTAYRVRDKLHNAKRIFGYPAIGQTERRDTQVRHLLDESTALVAELGGLIADLQREVG